MGAPTNEPWARSLGPTGLLRESRFTIEGGGDDMILDDEESKQRIYSPLVPAKPVAQPTLPSMPLVRRQVTLSSCEIKGYTCSQCPKRVQWLNICSYCTFDSGQNRMVFTNLKGKVARATVGHVVWVAQWLMSQRNNLVPHPSPTLSTSNVPPAMPVESTVLCA